MNSSFTCTPATLPITSNATTVAGTIATTTTLTLSTTTPAAGQAVTLTATVAAAAGASTAGPTGTVTFYDGTTILGKVTVTDIGVQGLATLSINIPVGTANSIIAAYSGDTIFSPSNSTASAITTAAAPATITLTSSVTSGLAGVALTLTAQVAGSTTTGVAPTGSVSFYLVGATPSLLGAVALQSAGAGLSVASFTTTGLPAGAQTVYAVYSGDVNFSPVTSNNVSIGLSDFGLTFNPSQLTISAGTSGATIATVNLINSFSGVITFGCLPQPNTDITCAFSPAVLNGAGTTTLTISTNSAGKAISTQHAANTQGSGLAGRIAGGTALAALLCVLLPGRRRRRLPTLLLGLLALALTTNLGCSSDNFANGGTTSTSTGTPLGSSIVTVTAAGTNGVSTVRHLYYIQVNTQ